MSFSYDPSTITVNKVHEVRFLIGQTDKYNNYIEDEEISYLLGKDSGNVDVTKYNAARAILATSALFYDKTTGQVSESMSQLYTNLKDLIDNPPAQDIEAKMPTPVCMHIGGIDPEEFALRNLDTTVVQTGTVTETANPWELEDEDVDGVETGCIDEYGRTQSKDQNLDELPVVP